MSPKVRFRRGLLKCLYSQYCHSEFLKKSADWYFGKTYLSFYCNLRKLKIFCEQYLTICFWTDIDREGIVANSNGHIGLRIFQHFAGGDLLAVAIYRGKPVIPQ